MTVAAIVRMEVADRLRQMAAGRPLKEAIGSLAHRLSMSPSRVKALIYGEARRVDAVEADAIRALHERLQQLQARRALLEAEMHAILRGQHADVDDRTALLATHGAGQLASGLGGAGDVPARSVDGGGAPFSRRHGPDRRGRP